MTDLMKNKVLFLLLTFFPILSLCDSRDEYFVENYQKLLELSEKGDRNAQYDLAWVYMKGTGVDKDLAKAHEWFKKSADQGNPYAQKMVGSFYQGVDDKQALHWFRLAAESGTPEHQHYLGTLYMLGFVAPKSEEKAIYWFVLASKQNYSPSFNQLGKIFSSSESSFQNFYKAYINFSIAKFLGHKSDSLKNEISFCESKLTSKEIVSAKNEITQRIKNGENERKLKGSEPDQPPRNR